MRRVLFQLLAVAVFGAIGGSAVLSADIDKARALYAEAAYEEALKELDATVDTSSADLVDQYRTLCYLALNQQRDAEAAIERIVNRSPDFRLDPAAASPKIVELLVQVRVRLLPVIARRVYAEAKGQYDLSQWASASEAFTQLLMVIREAEMAGVGAALSDLAQLGQGFLELSNREIARASAPPPPAVTRMDAALPPQETPAAPVTTPPSTPATAAAASTGSDPAPPAPSRPATSASPSPAPAEPPAPALNLLQVYSSADAGVSAPVALSREMPRWNPPAGVGTLRGSLEIVVNEQGLVESAALRAPIAQAYDRTLIAAARDWRFRPAMREGRPVKYRVALTIILSPPNGRP